MVGGGGGLGWNDLALFVIFEIEHIADDQVHFSVINKKKSKKFGRASLYKFAIFKKSQRNVVRKFANTLLLSLISIANNFFLIFIFKFLKKDIPPCQRLKNIYKKMYC